MSVISVRAAGQEDAESIFEMFSDFATSYRLDREAFDRTYSSLVSAAGADLLLAEDEHGAVGYLLACDMPTLFANGPVTELLELYVKPVNRNMGVGRLLVSTSVDQARDRGSVEVTVPTRRASEFYRAVGFELTAEFFKLKLPRVAEGELAQA